ncbi:MAG: tetratricopeptide repeat protein [Petrimonas sp.]|nr:tetratricopeptide repeat protein [Petrimonas sp.]
MKKIYILLLYLVVSIIPVFAQQSEQSLIKEGVALHDKGEYKQAIEKYREALKINPKSTSATYEMSLTYLEMKDYRNASKFSTQVINSNDKALSVGAYCVKSEAIAEMGNIDEAIKVLQDGIRKNGDQYLLHFNMALNYYKKNDLQNTLVHVKRAIDLSKTYSGAFLLNSYALKDTGLWVQSILSAQMFLLLEPDSRRSKNAFEEMLQTMLVKPKTETPVERSFIQQQLYRNNPKPTISPNDIPPLSIEEGLNRNLVYHAVKTTLDSIKTTKDADNQYITFTEVNKAILTLLAKENNGNKEETTFWNFYVPFFTEILQSDYYDTYCRYISVSYFPESLEWWNNNKEEARKFLNWFEHGDNKPAKK